MTDKITIEAEDLRDLGAGLGGLRLIDRNGELIVADELGIKLAGGFAVPLEQGLPPQKAEISGTFRATVEGFELKPGEHGRWVALVKVKVTSGRYEIVPPPPSLFDEDEGDQGA